MADNTLIPIVIEKSGRGERRKDTKRAQPIHFRGLHTDEQCERQTPEQRGKSAYEAAQ